MKKKNTKIFRLNIDFAMNIESCQLLEQQLTASHIISN